LGEFSQEAADHVSNRRGAEQKRFQIALYDLVGRSPYPHQDEASYEDEIVAGRTSETSMVRGGVAEGE